MLNTSGLPFRTSNTHVCAALKSRTVHRPPLFLALQVVCDQMQRLHGEDRPDRVCDAGSGVRLSPELLLLLRVRPPAQKGRRVCPEGGSAALQDRLREGERLAQLCQSG